MAKAKKKPVIEEEIVSIVPTALAVPLVEPVKKNFKHKNFKTCLVLFTTEGNEYWRVSLYPSKEDFDKYLAHPGQSTHPKVTNRRYFVVDRITGTLTEER